MKSLNAMMDEAIVELALASDRLAATSRTARAAQAAESAALARVNEAQQRIDELTDFLKKDAPLNSGWHSSKIAGGSDD